jgi:hypothetical protein
MQTYLNDWMRNFSFAVMSEDSKGLISHLDNETNTR